MQINFEAIDNHDRSMDFLNDPRINSIIKSSYSEKLSDKYDEWKLFSEHQLLNDIVEALYDTVGENFDRYDYLGSLGSSGAPLTYLLSAKYEKKAIFINDDWGVTGLFQPIKSCETEIKNKNILLVDSVFESGLTACNGIDILKKRAKKQNGFVNVDVLVITFFPEHTDEMFVKDYKDTTLYYLYYWNKSVIKEVKNRGILDI